VSKESDARKKALNGEANKKTRYEVQKKSVEKYLAGFDRITTRVPKGEKDIWKSAADAHGKSLNQYVIDLMHADNPDLFPAESEKTE
jgi:predicted HicB family RNase H-like nuclease